MGTLLIAVGALVGYLIAYHTYGRWLARKIFKLDPDAKVPSVELNDDRDGNLHSAWKDRSRVLLENRCYYEPEDRQHDRECHEQHT